MGVDWKRVYKHMFMGIKNMYILVGLIILVGAGVIFIVILTGTDSPDEACLGTFAMLAFMLVPMGIGMGLSIPLLSLYQYTFVKNLKTGDIETEDLFTTQKRVFMVDMSEKNALTVVQKVITDLKTMEFSYNLRRSMAFPFSKPLSKVTKVDGNRIKGSFHMWGWYSYMSGLFWYHTVIDVRVIPRTKEHCIIEVTTHPLWKSYPFDYGSSLEAMLRFEHLIGVENDDKRTKRGLKPSWLG